MLLCIFQGIKTVHENPFVSRSCSCLRSTAVWAPCALFAGPLPSILRLATRAQFARVLSEVPAGSDGWCTYIHMYMRALIDVKVLWRMYKVRISLPCTVCSNAGDMVQCYLRLVLLLRIRTRKHLEWCFCWQCETYSHVLYDCACVSMCVCNSNCVLFKTFMLLARMLHAMLLR